MSAHNQIKQLPLCPSDLPGGHLNLIDQGPFTYPTDRAKVVPMTKFSLILQVAWLWCIFFAFAAPELFNLFHCIRVIFMKVHNTSLNPQCGYHIQSVTSRSREFPFPGIVLFFDGIGTGIENIWYRKKSRNRYRKNLVPKKSQNRSRKNLVPEKSLGTGIGKFLY